MFAGGEADPFAVGFDTTDLEVFLGDRAKEIAELYGQSVEGDPMMGDVEAIADEAQKIEQIKARKREYDAEQAADLPENYVLVVFPNVREKRAFMKAWQLDPDTRVVDAVRWGAILDEECKARCEEVEA